MTESDDQSNDGEELDMGASLRSIADVFDGAIAKAERKMNVQSESFSPNQTMTGFKLEDEKFEASFEGQNAAVIARPIHELIGRHVEAERSGSSSQDRKIAGEGDLIQVQGAQRALQNFMLAAQTPEVQQAIEDKVLMGMQLEQVEICKVALKFDVSDDGGLNPIVTSVITSPRSELAHRLKNEDGVRVSDVGEWKDSNLKPVGEGIRITLISDEGRDAFQRVAEDMIRTRLPAPDDIDQRVLAEQNAQAPKRIEKKPGQS